ncbi:MAG: hypothetical protein COB02_07495 [Candidatus Cloacimonadota bacterium]|nr:MAG: hypothetical protein COB02_07495 [Candidatus Cloacimonadota bacterium]
MWFNLARYWHVWIDFISKNTKLCSKELLSYLWFPPILFAGPIETYQDFQKFYQKPRKVNIEIFFTLMLTAFFSGIISYLINQHLSNYTADFSHESAFSLFTYINLSSILIFFDMSSWICSSRAVAHLMGYPFDSINFKIFLLSKNPIQFWNRWNMSFTRWIQRYIFANSITLFMNKKLHIITWTFIWFIACGLLHNYSLHFVIWGTIHALGILITYSFLKPKMALQKLPFYNAYVYRTITTISTLLFLHITCIFMSPHYFSILNRYKVLVIDSFY